MVPIQSAIYREIGIGEGFLGGITGENLFLILDFAEGIQKEQGEKILDEMQKDDSVKSITNLKSFEQFISQSVSRYNFPSAFSLSGVFLTNKVLYLKTVGSGKIYLKRGSHFAKIIEGNNSGSGLVQNGDFFVLLTERFIETLGSDVELRALFDHRNPQEVVEYLTSIFQNRDKTAVALFLQYKKTDILQKETREAIQGDHSKRKMITFFAVIILSLIFVWSVVLGYQRRSQSQITKKITATKELVSYKLSQAEEVAFLNLPRSMILLSEAKFEVEKLKKELGDLPAGKAGKRNEVGEMEKMIKSVENKIVKKEDKKYEEFFDLTIDNKNASGEKMYLGADKLSILDKKNKTIYTLSLVKKSLDKRMSSDILTADLISSDNDTIFFLKKGDGIFQISADEKTKEIIPNDPDWGNIKDFWVYNGNIYLLDNVKDDIYKYLVAANGYSAKSSYFTGDKSSLTDPNSIAIDSSVYVGVSNTVLKFTGGIRETFSPSWPEENIHIDKVFTTSELEKIFVWDKNNSALYILNKNGTYERQISSSVLKKASDCVIFGNSAYVLVKEKIYRIHLD